MVYAEELDLEVQQKSTITNRSVGHFSKRVNYVVLQHPVRCLSVAAGSESDPRGGPTGMVMMKMSETERNRHFTRRSVL
jgi:hypothetical protein